MAIDIARIYVVKVWLQQSCDASILAGRKFMTDTSASTALDSIVRDKRDFSQMFNPAPTATASSCNIYGA